VLTASRIGDGARRLVPDVAGLLSPVTEWRRIMLVCASPAGVSIALGGIDSCTVEGRHLRLRSPHVDTRLSLDAVKRAFWFVRRDGAHGRSRSLQFFDASGEAVLKVMIPHRQAAIAAERHFSAFAAASQSRTEEVPAAHPPPVPLPPGMTSDDAGLFRAVFCRLPELAGRLAIGCHAASTVQTAMVRLHAVRDDGRMLHIHESVLRMHLRPWAIEDAVVRTAADGAPAAIAFMAGGRRVLTVSSLPEHGSDAFAAWLERIPQVNDVRTAPLQQEKLS
jgi:putative heme degradation protein